MIEKNVIQSPYYETLVGTFLELKSVIRTLRFIEDKTNYATCKNQKRTSLFTLLPRVKKQSSRPVQCGVQKRLTISYIHRYDRLSIIKQGFSFESGTTYTIIYAKNTEPNTESHQVISTSICRSYKEGIRCTIKGAISNYESNKSGALCSNENTIKEVNLIELKLNSKTLLLIFCFNGFRMIKILSLDLNFMRVKELKFNSFESIKKPSAIYQLLTSHTDHYIEL